MQFIGIHAYFYLETPIYFLSLFFFRFYLLIFKKRERNIDVRKNIDPLPLKCALPGDQTHNPGMCPGQESN